MSRRDLCIGACLDYDDDVNGVAFSLVGERVAAGCGRCLPPRVRASSGGVSGC